MLPRLAEHRAALIAADAESVRQRAGDATDLEPGLAARAPHRTSYRGLDMLEVHLRARRALLFDRFADLWRESEERGVWRLLTRAADSELARAAEARRAAERAERARQALEAAERRAPGGRRARHSGRRRAGRGRGRRTSPLADGGRPGGSDSDGRPSAAPARLAVYS